MNTYCASDGKWFWLVGAESERHWPGIVAALGDPRAAGRRTLRHAARAPAQRHRPGGGHRRPGGAALACRMGRGIPRPRRLVGTDPVGRRTGRRSAGASRPVPSSRYPAQKRRATWPRRSISAPPRQRRPGRRRASAPMPTSCWPSWATRPKKSRGCAPPACWRPHLRRFGREQRTLAAARRRPHRRVLQQHRRPATAP